MNSGKRKMLIGKGRMHIGAPSFAAFCFMNLCFTATVKYSTIRLAEKCLHFMQRSEANHHFTAILYDLPAVPTQSGGLGPNTATSLPICTHAEHDLTFI